MNILLNAYVDLNLGDDLFIDCIVRRYAEHDLYLLCDSETILNVQLAKYKNLKRLGYKQALKAVWRMDVLLIVGGSIFQDNPQYYKYDHMRNALVTIYKLFGKKIYVMGSNVGPVNSMLGRIILQYCIVLSNHISVRDTSSLKLLQSWGMNRGLSCAPDMIFSYDFDAPKNHVDEKIGLGISVIQHGRDKLKKEQYIKKLAEIVDEYLMKSDPSRRVALFAFDGGLENDGEIVDAVFKMIGGESGRVDRYYYNEKIAISEFMEKFLSCGYLICSRFHSVVLALKYGIPCFPIVYASKTINLLTDIGFDRAFIEYGSIGNVDAVVVAKDASTQKAAFALPVDYEKKSAGHFAALDAFLSGK